MMTKAMTAALRWLEARGGTALLPANGIAMAMGDAAPVRRSTWNKLRDQGAIEITATDHGPPRIQKVTA
jgi:hypothetical protein